MESTQALDLQKLEALARDAFSNYPGHYWNDSQLDRHAALEVYPSWALSLGTRVSPVQPLWLAMEGQQMMGFLATTKVADDTRDVTLLGVASAARRRGIARLLLTSAIYQAHDYGLRQFTYSTQLSNVGMLRLLAQLGFLPTHSVHTFHLWRKLWA